MHPSMGASGSDAKQNCPSTTLLSPRKAFAIGTISLFAEFYQLMSCMTRQSLHLSDFLTYKKGITTPFAEMT